MKRIGMIAAVASAIVVSSSVVYATDLGMPNATGFTYSDWDTFPTDPYAGFPPIPQTPFSNDAPDSFDGTLFSVTLTSTLDGGYNTGGGTRIYQAGQAFDFTLNGTAGSTTITTLSVVLKFTPPGTGTAADFFTVSLTGVGEGEQVFLGSSLEGTNNFQIYQWTWTGLNIAALSAFEITATGPADHSTIDYIRVTDQVAVPEPASLALAVLGVGALFLRRSSVKNRN